MKKYAVITLLLAVLLVFTACSPKTYTEADPAKYVTLGEYKGLSYTPASGEVSDYELQLAVNEKLKDSGYVTYDEDIELKEGTVQIGDTVNINYKGLENGVAFEGGTADNQSLTIGSGSFIEGFEEGLVGKTIGSDVTLNLTFPESYHNAEMAGKSVVFEVKINSVTERANYKELTDDLAHLLNSKVNTVPEFKAAIKEELAAEKLATAEEEIKSNLWNTVVENATFTEKLPKALLEQAKKEFTSYYESLATQYGYDTLDELLKGSGIDSDEFYTSADNYARQAVEHQLAAYAIAKAEGYTPTQEALDATAAEYAANNGYSDGAKFAATVGDEVVHDLHVADYARDLVFENAKAAQ